ncbi:bifunctional DNA primase/polymerase [Planktothrix sp. FACHB-1355]|uniref:Bifunctional DNA primase/polymerase n=1 Tax=Aerosakkonema funiforme FACHB-1375 TaxID=2949571 RepID=A0A926VBX6_9CYAN|nr:MULTISPECIES: bifunctional DNA primase/polymerase [Oscillatoriales]MBD2181039.1 bifunctional DNA primase/polymerase [Aerosakkonema funiforme FACHB-1375]MBD3557939.1 bifunctional DNA primase/polymerase [Planktothrix sp. FACHB-1355]
MTVNNSITRRLVEGLYLIPKCWQIVPTNGNKQPLGYQWQLNPFSKQELIRQLQSTGSVIVKNRTGVMVSIHPQGIGILTGKKLVAVDVDGSSAMNLLRKLSGNNIPPTVAFTSGKPSRCQYLFSIPAKVSATSRRIKASLSGEALEIRASGMMSVLPPSVHPQTGRYCWVRNGSPAECAIAPAPDWLIELMQKRLISDRIPKNQDRKERSHHLTSDRIAQKLAQIAPWRADDYHEWIRIGMALYSFSPVLLWLWDEWSKQSPKYQPGVCSSKWATFSPNRISLGSIYYLAALDSYNPCSA